MAVREERGRALFEDELYRVIVAKVFVSNGAAAVEEAEKEANSHRDRASDVFSDWCAKKADEARAARAAAAAAAREKRAQEKVKAKRSKSALRQWSTAMRSQSYVSYRSQTPVRVPRPTDARIVTGRPLWQALVPSPDGGVGDQRQVATMTRSLSRR